MPTAAERLELNRTLDQLAGRSYAEIAAHSHKRSGVQLRTILFGTI